MTTAVDEVPWRWDHYERLGPHLVVEVRGLPVPQGSIRSLGKGRPSIHSNAERLLPWRDRVQTAFEQQLRCAAGQPGLFGPFPLTGPVIVDATFTMSKPKSAPKKRRTFPTTQPDTDKLQRAIGDAMQAAGVVKNDSQIIQWGARKVYPLEAPQSLPVPGLYVFVYGVRGATWER